MRKLFPATSISQLRLPKIRNLLNKQKQNPKRNYMLSKFQYFKRSPLSPHLSKHTPSPTSFCFLHEKIPFKYISLINVKFNLQFSESGQKEKKI